MLQTLLNDEARALIVRRLREVRPDARSRTLVKFLVVRTGFQPPRGKIETAPEMLHSQPTSWEADLLACIDLTERVGRGTARAVHPTFGPLTPDDWGRLCWKHLNHHLVQFSS